MKKIQDIEKGMVFDHLDVGVGGSVFDALKGRVWPKQFCPIIIGSFPSARKGRKDIAKLDGVHLEEGSQALNDIALLSPEATINWISGGLVAKKKKAFECISQFIESPLVGCANSNCIAHEEAVPKFFVKTKSPLVLKCYYCDRTFERKGI